MSSIVCSLHHVSIGHLHATQTPRSGKVIRFELRACYGATICMGKEDPEVGSLSITWDDELKIINVTVEVCGIYPHVNYLSLLGDSARIVSIAQMCVSNL